MNPTWSRRDVLWSGLAAAAAMGCDSMKSAPKAAEPVAAPPVVSPAPVNEVSRLPPQTGAPRLVFAGERLALLGAEGMTVWQTVDGASAAVALERPCGLSGAADGSLWTLEQPAAAPGQVRLRRAPPQGATQEATGPVMVGFGAPAFLLPTSAEEAFVVAFGQNGARSRLAFGEGGALRLLGFEALGYTGVAAVLPDGVVIHSGPSGLVRVSAAGSAALPLPAGVDPPLLLAPGAAGQVWSSGATSGLTLLSTGDSPAVVWAVQQGAQVFHLAARGAVAAALLVEQEPTGRSPSWSIAVFAADKGERWRASLPALSRPMHSYIALSERQVAVSDAGDVRVFSAADGEVLR